MFFSGFGFTNFDLLPCDLIVQYNGPWVRGPRATETIGELLPLNIWEFHVGFDLHSCSVWLRSQPLAVVEVPFINPDGRGLILPRYCIAAPAKNVNRRKELSGGGADPVATSVVEINRV